ncbi:MAG: Zn-dependent hydrolase, glyoxylase [Actinomycetia bacterium]|nr:Zn-dependent hydrolase, glyoxylase [Actinomycetes bacterium]
MLVPVSDDPANLALTELADGVFAWLPPNSRTGVSNAGIVVEDDGITVIDTLMVRSQWEPFAEAVKAFDRPVRRTILTNAHIDHVGGTKAFPASGVYASPQTSDLLDLEMPIEAYRNFMPEFADELTELAELGTRAATHIVDGAAQFTERIEVLPAAGHTSGDLLVLIADADICFAGDLCFFGVTPLAFQGDPALWADVLDAVAELADILVPGHGPVGGEEELRDLQRYLRACVAADGDVAAIGPGPWDSWVERDRDAINVERAALMAQGRDDVPPSMLRAMGFG